MFEFRYNSNGDSIVGIPDFTINATYAVAAKPGDVVKLNTSGEVVAAVTGDTEVLGVFIGPEIKVEADTTYRGKVRVHHGDVFEADVTGGDPIVGTSYGINDDSVVDIADTTTTVVTAVAISPRAGKGYFKITGRQLG